MVTQGATVDPQWLIENPQASLYGLDAATTQAIFVEVAPEVNLAAAPFVYQAQYQSAQRLFATPFSQLVELSERLETKLDRLIPVAAAPRSYTKYLTRWQASLACRSQMA